MSKRKQRLIRFSLRSMLGLTLVVAVYFALGSPTRTRGVAAVSDAIEREFGSKGRPAYVAPMFLEYWEMRATGGQDVEIERHYYVWFPGFVFKAGTRITNDTFTPTRRSDEILSDCLLAEWPPAY